MHWKHSRFETAYIILGNCHTYDEAYRILCELEEDREFSIESALAESLRAQAKVVTSKTVLADEHETRSGKLLAQCNIDEQRARTRIAQPCMDEARRELQFIRHLKSLVQPRRVFLNQPDHVAHQSAQYNEWMFDLQWKTYNHLAATGHIPHDHLMLLKMHPASKHLISGMFELRNRLQTSTDVFLMMAKETVLDMVAHDDESAAGLMTMRVFSNQSVLDDSIYTPLSKLTVDAEQRNADLKIQTNGVRYDV